MRVLTFTMAHMEAANLGAMLGQVFSTIEVSRIDRWLICPHHWPLDTQRHHDAVTRLALAAGAEIVNPEKNLGGTEGANFLVRELNPNSEDLLLWLDGDSWPVTDGWLQAMIEVMAADPTIATLSLWNTEMSGKTDWVEEVVAGRTVRTFPTHSEAFSVTMWRGHFVFPKIEAERAYYGDIETMAYRKAQRLGMRCAWLADFKEIACPIAHPPIYEEWKREHVAGRFNGNFDAYVRERCIES